MNFGYRGKMMDCRWWIKVYAEPKIRNYLRNAKFFRRSVVVIIVAGFIEAVVVVMVVLFVLFMFFMFVVFFVFVMVVVEVVFVVVFDASVCAYCAA